MSRFPFGIPNSWYLIAYSDELLTGDVRRLEYLDRELVAFRGESGQLIVLDAHCPHLGANLAVGGKVVGDTIQCPLHAWRWGADGACAEIPYSKQTSSKARAVSYPVMERNGMVFIWFHAEGKAPDFEIPKIVEWGESGWLSHWLRWEWTVKTHPQEMAENGIDWPHFGNVHGMALPADRDCSFQPGYYTWQIGGTKTMSTLEHRSDKLMLYGENWGLGYSWLRQFGQFETIVATGLTPIDKETTHMRMGVIARMGGRDEGELKAYMDEHAVFAEQDFAIWENKKFREKPPLCPDDGPILEFRRWAAQFYQTSGVEPASDETVETDVGGA